MSSYMEDIYRGANRNRDEVEFVAGNGVQYILTIPTTTEDWEEVREFLRAGVEHDASIGMYGPPDDLLDEGEYTSAIQGAVCTYQGGLVVPIFGPKQCILTGAATSVWGIFDCTLCGMGYSDGAYTVFVHVGDPESIAMQPSNLPAIDTFLHARFHEDGGGRGSRSYSGREHRDRRHGGRNPGGRRPDRRPHEGRHGGGSSGVGRPGSLRPGRSRADRSTGGGLEGRGPPESPAPDHPGRGSGSSMRRPSTATNATANTGYFGAQSDAGQAFGGMRR
ncbi:MAG: hypothetical protein M1812_003591 [Candelaria pacifica]|nr:MAG: hypothetical protein M1812_003591 [Candelaria pacifica]